MSVGTKKNTSKFRVLVAPLDWGLGHATRCIPIIKTLISLNIEPVIAAYGSGYKFLKSEFPALQIILFPGFKLQYPRRKYLRLKVVLSFPALIISIIREHYSIKKIIRELEIDAIISDGRYGLFSSGIPSVFITHQLLIKLPGLISFLEYPLYLINRNIINKYSFCWLPDVPGNLNLSGDLCHKYDKGNCTFIGPLNRFVKGPTTYSQNEIDILIIISGLEKQRTVFEELIFSQVTQTDKKITILRGLPGETEKINIKENVTVYSHLEAEQLYSLLLNSEIVICRSGYTTVMELSSIGKKAVFVPTPGQTEQEYLAEYYEKEKYAPSFPQVSFNLKEALNKVNEYEGIPEINGSDLLINAARQLLKEIEINQKNKMR